MKIVNRNGSDVWVDYGYPPTERDRALGRKFHGGGVLDMAMELGGLDKAGAIELLKSLSSSPHLVESPVVAPRISTTSSEYSYIIDNVSDRFTVKVLSDYASGVRCIPEDVLSRYCREVTYHHKDYPNRKYVKIGFPHDNGGWSLRGSRPGNYSKVTTKSGITTIAACTDMHAEPRCAKGYIFEGFFDFMSWVAWVGDAAKEFDVCVLNSTANVYSCLGWVRSHQEVGACLDNDASGRNALEVIRSHCRDVLVADCSGVYEGFKDLNEKYVSRCRELTRVSGLSGGICR